VAGDVAGSAAEVASLSDAFATAVQVFSEANDKLLDNLQQVESRLEQSSARADEQLNYYVEQAREVIELSMASQKEVIDALGTLNGAGKNVAQSEERPASEVN
jgi:methyl-accepting chemotaxis protein